MRGALGDRLERRAVRAGAFPGGAASESVGAIVLSGPYAGKRVLQKFTAEGGSVTLRAGIRLDDVEIAVEAEPIGDLSLKGLRNAIRAHNVVRLATD